MFTTLGGRILDDESPYDKEFVKKVRRAEKSKKHEIDIDKIWE